MKNLTLKSLFTTFIFLLIILIFSYFLIFNPLYKALEETLLENFVYISETNKVSFEHILERGLENANSISSRTMIKNKIIEYKDGIVDLEELKEYTQPKYIDGIKALENVIYSARIVDNKIIAIHGDETINLTATEYVDELSYEIILEDEKIYLLVYSPVESRVTIGMDIVVFDLSNVLDKMDLGNILIDVIKKEEMAEYQDKATINPLISECHSSDDIVYLNIFYEINDNHFLHISTMKDLFYNKFYKIAQASGIYLIIVFVLSLIGINLIIISFAKKKIVTLDISNEKHKRDSYYDTLTGAYTRLYLDQWLKESNNKLDYSIVLIDIDDFKNINDKYGHQKGDEVLRAIVLLIKDEIRHNDFVVRYGGDEFIILLNCECRDMAIDIIERINRSLELSNLLELEVSFSYGVGELKNSSEFYDVFKEIDLQMYEMKKYNIK